MGKHFGRSRALRGVLVLAATLGAPAAFSPASADAAPQSLFLCPTVADLGCSAIPLDQPELTPLVDDVADQACTAIGPVVVPLAEGTAAAVCVVETSSDGKVTYVASVGDAKTPIMVGTSGGRCVASPQDTGSTANVVLGGPHLGLTTCDAAQTAAKKSRKAKARSKASSTRRRAASSAATSRR